MCSVTTGVMVDSGDTVVIGGVYEFRNREDISKLPWLGDVPLLGPATLSNLAALAGRGQLALLTMRPESAEGYGRIVRDPAGHVARIVEQKDASAAELALSECNTGVLAAPAGPLGARTPPTPRAATRPARS